MKTQGLPYRESFACEAPTLPNTYRVEVSSVSTDVSGDDGTNACFKKCYMCTHRQQQPHDFFFRTTQRAP